MTAITWNTDVLEGKGKEEAVDTYEFYHTECGIINIYHEADLHSHFTSVFNCYKSMLLQGFTWWLLLYECWAFYIWLSFECRRQSTLFFHRLWIAEYCTGLLVWWSAHLPTFSVLCSRPSRGREDCTVFLLIFGDWLRFVDGQVHSKFRRLRMSDYYMYVRFLLHCWGVLLGDM